MGNTRSVIIIGVGQIGSRHLQALKAVKFPLSIYVMDESEESLRVAKERYDAMPARKIHHSIEYGSNLPPVKSFDVAIIATSSGPRAVLIKELLSKSKVKYLILEKLLFSKKNDYAQIGKLLKSKKVKAWVNCPMRMIPFYKGLKKEFGNQNITYILHGNQSGLASDLIHQLDYMAYLTGSKDFILDTSLLDKKTKPSKRKGYLEVTGTLTARFSNGSFGLFRCDAQGSTPKTIGILSQNKTFFFKESEMPIPYQSQLTTILVESLLETGKCELPTYEESSRYHLLFLEPLRKHHKLKYYLFT